MTMLRTAKLFLACSSSLAQAARAEQTTTVKIQIDPATTISTISPDFIGLGYETSAVAQPNYFTGSNATLVQLYRNLTDHGLIRIGGCASDNTLYQPDGTPIVRTFHEVSVINKKNLLDFGAFVHATGWKVMWGLNLGNGTKDQAVKEAVAINDVLGDRLQSFQIGNEVENLSRFKRNFDAYHDAYRDFKSGVRASLPNASFSGPDSVGHWDWITRFADAEGGDMQLLTHHYYCGDAHDHIVNIEEMLAGDERMIARQAQLRDLCQAKGLHYRINEVNSFSGGGKIGVSDTFASAIWCLDYMFTLASYGCNGVNMETDVNHLAWISHYSPIIHDDTGKCTARPEYYGMLAFAMASKGELLKLTLEAGNTNLTAYATRPTTGDLCVTIINKDLVKDTDVELTLPSDFSSADAYRLMAPTAKSTDQVSFANATVAPDGKWAAGPSESLTASAGSIHFRLRHISAIICKLRKQ